MFIGRRPRDAAIRAFLDAQAAAPFSYAEVGCTRGDAPAGYAVNHHRVRLGAGAGVFERAVAALGRWRMFAIGGVALCWPDTPQRPGATVAILAGAGPIWFLNACRVVYAIDEAGPLVRRGFAYGTLPAHAVRGEERFTVEWSPASDAVSYELLAFSQPAAAWLRAAPPLLRTVQRRFARASLAAMRRAVVE